MNFAVYGRSFGNNFNGMAIQLFEELKSKNVNIYIKDSFNDFLNKKIKYYPVVKDVFSDKLPKKTKFDLMLSIGGDGTFLEAATVVGDSGTPILGINTGKMGFLAYVNESNIIKAIEQFFNKEYLINKRMLLTVESEDKFYGDINFCLNELAIHKKAKLKMIKIKAYADDNYINTYWSDGIIISTPTGSTAYSLSCGGPIIDPDADAIVITPIANHNLTVRPLVLSGNSKITIEIDSPEANAMASMDYRTFYLSDKATKPNKIEIKKANFYINFVRLSDNNYFCTLRNKLMWGTDIRN